MKSVDEVLKIISQLSFGDLVVVEWLDAREESGRMLPKAEDYDTPVTSAGFFLGLRGRKAKHLVIAKEVVHVKERPYHYNVIPIGMIQQLMVCTCAARSILQPEARWALRKFALRTMSRITKKDGWVYASSVKEDVH